jgi:type II secretory pathway pseudopilin PulG
MGGSNVSGRAKHVRGIGLLEGLVAVAILAVGLLALFSFQAGVVGAGAEAKARTEALQIAESRLGELRTRASDHAHFAALGGDGAANFQSYLSAEAASAPTEVQGTNALFTVDMAYPGTGPRPAVSVIVSWPAPGGGVQSVAAGAEIGLKDPAGGVLLATTEPGGGGIPSPTGIAEYGKPGEKRQDLVASGTPNGDGTLSAVDAVSGTHYLLAGDGQVLIKAKQPLARISGSVYVQAGVSFDRSYIKVGAPDVSWCTTTWDPSDSNLRILAGGTHVYDKLPYNCYVGAGWYGAIGPLAFKPDPDAVFDPQVTNATFIKSEFGSNDHACVGDDDASPTMVNVAGTPTVAVYSEHAQLSFIRTYRGYTQVFRGGQPVVDSNGNYLFGSQGIVLPVENNQPQPLWIPDHDFVLATINQADDGKCVVLLALGDGTDFPEPVTLSGNPGRFFCLTREGCPAVLPVDTGEAAAAEVRIRGRFLDETGARLGPSAGVSVRTDSGTQCPAPTDGDDDYECVVYALDSGWTGDIRASAPAGFVMQPRLVQYSSLLLDARQDFTRRTASPTPFTIRGSVTLYGGATYTSIVSDKGGACTWQTFEGKPWNGAFNCAYSDLPSDAIVKITVVTGSATKTLCATSGRDTGMSTSVAAKTLTIDGVYGGVIGVNLDVAKQSGDCPP